VRHMTPLEQKVLLLVLAVLLVGWTTRAWLLATRRIASPAGIGPEGRTNRVSAP
jgi:hypothetical protein